MIANISDYKATAFISIDNGLDHKILFTEIVKFCCHSNRTSMKLFMSCIS